MLPSEYILCLTAVVASSASQLCLKVAARDILSVTGAIYVLVASIFMLFSMLVAYWVLREIRLNELVPFAALAYILVPLGGVILIGEEVGPSFWVGSATIIAGILLTIA